MTLTKDSYLLLTYIIIEKVVGVVLLGAEEVLRLESGVLNRRM